MLAHGVGTDQTVWGPQGAPAGAPAPYGRPAPPSHVGALSRSDPFSVGQYTLLGRLGAGGMGTVYLALAADGRQVALKMIRPELAEDTAFVQRFHREVQAARRVASFCTARVIDAGLDTPRPYMVTEYVDGPRLDYAVEQDGPLRDSSLEAFAVGVAAALTAIHSAGLVHRDLKPSNVLLSRFGPRVIDFGIARALDASTMLTKMNVALGTPGWMAPEQVNNEEVTTAADVFAWGALVAYAASGQPPFGEGSLSAVAYRIVHERPSLDGLTGQLLSLVSRAMDKDPSRRPTARQLLLDLLGDQAPPDPGAAVTDALHRTWTPPPSAAAALPEADAATVRRVRPSATPPITGTPDPDAETTERLRPVRLATPGQANGAANGRRLPAAGNPAPPDRRTDLKRALPPAGRPFPVDRPAAAKPSSPAAPPIPPVQQAPPSRPTTFPRQPGPVSIPRPRPQPFSRPAPERPPVSIPRQSPGWDWDRRGDRERPASAAPTGPRPGMFRRFRRATAQVLAVPAVLGGAIAFIQLLRTGFHEEFAYYGSILFGLLTLAFLIMPRSRQHRGRSALLRLVGLAAIFGVLIGIAQLLALTGWDPLVDVDPFGPYTSSWQQYSTRLAALFGVLTVTFYAYPKDR